ncbi:MAG TPA: hypothetical protein VIV57_08715 [Anaeromyxobacter sp.]
MTRPIFALLVALLAGACATHRASSSQQKAAAAATPQVATGKPLVLCRPERPTGSNIMTRVCYSEDDIGALDPAAQEELRRALQQGSYQPIRN